MERVKLVFFLCILALSGPSYAQWNEEQSTQYHFCSDTLFFSSGIVTLIIPDFSLTHKSYDQYDEGTFITFPLFDSSYICMFHGYNSNHPLFDISSVDSVIDTILDNQIVRIFTGHDKDYNIIEYFFPKKHISILFDRINNDKILLCNKILQSLIFIKND